MYKIISRAIIVLSFLLHVGSVYGDVVYPVTSTGEEIKVTGVNLFENDNFEMCSMEEESANLSDSNDEELVDSLITKNCDELSQDDFMFKGKEPMFDDTDRVATKLAEESTEANIYNSELPETLLTTLKQPAESSVELAEETAEKLAASVSSDVNPLSEIVMNLVFCATAVIQGEASHNLDDRMIFDNCTGPIGMLDQLVQLGEFVIQAIGKLVHADRDFIWLVNERQQLARDAIKVIEQDIDNMIQLTARHYTASADSLSAGLRGLLEGKIDQKLYQETINVFNIDKNDVCLTYKESLAELSNQVTPYQLGLDGSSLEDERYPSSSIVVDNYQLPSEAEISWMYFMHDEDDGIINGIGIVDSLGGNTFLGGGYGEITWVEAISFDRMVIRYSRQASWNNTFITGMWFYKNGAVIQRIGDTGSDVGEEDETIDIDLSVQDLRAIETHMISYYPAARESAHLKALRIVTTDKKSPEAYSGLKASYDNLYQCATERMQSNLAFLESSRLENNINAYLHKLQSIVEHKNTIAERLISAQVSLFQQHRQHMVNQLEKYNELPVLQAGEKYTDNYIYQLNAEIESALRAQADEVVKAHPIEHSAMEYNSEDYVTIPESAYFLGLEEKTAIPFRLGLPILDRRTIENLIDEKTYTTGFISKYLTAVPKYTLIDIQRDQQILFNLLNKTIDYPLFNAQIGDIPATHFEDFNQCFFQPLLNKTYSDELSRFPIMEKLLDDVVQALMDDFGLLFSLNSAYEGFLQSNAVPCTDAFKLYSEQESPSDSEYTSNDDASRFQKMTKEELFDRYMETEEWEFRKGEWDVKHITGSQLYLAASGAKVKIQQHRQFKDIHRAMIFCPADAHLSPNEIVIAEEINPHLIVNEITPNAFTRGKWWYMGMFSPDLDYLALKACGVSPSVTSTVTNEGEVDSTKWQEAVVSGDYHDYTILRGQCSGTAHQYPNKEFYFVKSPFGAYISALNKLEFLAQNAVVHYCGHDEEWLVDTMGVISGNSYSDEFGYAEHTDPDYVENYYIDSHRLTMQCGEKSVFSGLELKDFEGSPDVSDICDGDDYNFECYTVYNGTSWNILGRHYRTESPEDIATMVDSVCAFNAPNQWLLESHLHNEAEETLQWYTDFGISHGNSSTLYVGAEDNSLYKVEISCAADANIAPSSKHEIYYRKQRVSADGGYVDPEESGPTKLTTNFYIKKYTESDSNQYEIVEYTGPKLRHNRDEELALKQAVMDMAAKECGVGGFTNVGNYGNSYDRYNVGGSTLKILQAQTKAESLTDFLNSTKIELWVADIACSERAVLRPNDAIRVYANTNSDWKLDGITYERTLFGAKELTSQFCGAEKRTTFEALELKVENVDDELEVKLNDQLVLDASSDGVYDLISYVNGLDRVEYGFQVDNSGCFNWGAHQGMFVDGQVAFYKTVSGSWLSHCGNHAKSGMDIFSANANVTGEWELSSGRNHSGVGNRKYRLYYPTTGNVTISLESESVDTYLYLTQNTDILAQDDDSGFRFNALIKNKLLSPGVYDIVAATFHSGEQGDFKIEAYTNVIQSEWFSSGGQDVLSNNNRRYKLHVTERAEVRLTLHSSKDTYLYLLADDGETIIFENDDVVPGDYNTSVIERMLKAGTYYVIAATFWDNEVGDFTLLAERGNFKLPMVTNYWSYYD